MLFLCFAYELFLWSCAPSSARLFERVSVMALPAPAAAALPFVYAVWLIVWRICFGFILYYIISYQIILYVVILYYIPFYEALAEALLLHVGTAVCFHNFTLLIFNLRVSNPNTLIVDVFFDTMLDFNVPGSRPKKTRWNFGNRLYAVWLIVWRICFWLALTQRVFPSTSWPGCPVCAPEAVEDFRLMYVFCVIVVLVHFLCCKCSVIAAAALPAQLEACAL